MSQLQSPIVESSSIPEWFLAIVREYVPDSEGRYAAQLLWQRGIQDANQLASFVDPDAYQPTSPFAFGQEMKWAIKRLQTAREKREKVTIWGDFDADGITATSVLWEGLGQFFPQYLQLNYTIPNRLRESHGLNCQGIERLVAEGTRLIVTCDTGSTNLTEIDFANELGIDIIITDHHTLPEERPPVISIINPRYFSETHPLFNLSGVAVAYKLIEALYLTFPDIPQQPLEELLDLVAIGLIADLVELKGDCRYLAQKGIKQLQKRLDGKGRPGVTKLLDLCKGTGDRPTDISFGVGPRINAVSRIQGDASFCVELLTSRDSKHCKKLAIETELANTRRKALQKEIVKEVQKKILQVDLSTTSVIVLEDPQWQSGILGLVAGQIAKECGRPTILLSTGKEMGESDLFSMPMARGSARSINNIDLYQLVASQSHLLHRFGGHPLAAGLSLPAENIPLFREAINQQLRQQFPDSIAINSTIKADLIVTVSELGRDLFQELKLLEPCGMGNPVPKLLIRHCRFEVLYNVNEQDLRRKKVKYIKTIFKIYDDSCDQGFPGVWWGHHKENLPVNTECDAIVELDFNKKDYEIRLLELYCNNSVEFSNDESILQTQLIDWRGNSTKKQDSEVISLKKCPQDLQELQQKYRQAIAKNKKLALAYPFPEVLTGEEILDKLIGIAKYLSRTQKSITIVQLQAALGLNKLLLELALDCLAVLGFKYTQKGKRITIINCAEINKNEIDNLKKFLDAIAEVQFQQQYFYQAPLSNLAARLNGEELGSDRVRD